MNSETAATKGAEATAGQSAPAIPWAKPDFWGNEQRYVAEALSSSWISGGAFVDRLERDIASYLGVPYAVTSSNGTTALHAALLAIGLGPGDEIVVPGFSFLAAANLALHMRAKPVFAEVDPATWCMRASDIEKVLSPRTKAIVPVHTYGNICEMDEILELSAAKSVTVIEDAAESFASRYKRRFAGTIAPMGTFSFHATKTITTGEGGMVVTASRDLHDRLSLYRNHGMRRTRYWHEVPGHNFRMTNMQAALGCAQFEHLDAIVRERSRVFDAYRKRLAKIDGVTLQHYGPNVEPVVWAVALNLDRHAYPQGRDEVIRQLADAGIETRNGFFAASLLAHLYHSAPLPICEELSRQVISLPTYCSLADEQIDFICARLKDLRR